MRRIGKMNCVVCGRSATEFCAECKKLKWETQVKLMHLRRIADTLMDMERKMKDENGW